MSFYLGLRSMVGILYGVWYLFITVRKHVEHTCPADDRHQACAGIINISKSLRVLVITWQHDCHLSYASVFTEAQLLTAGLMRNCWKTLNVVPYQVYRVNQVWCLIAKCAIERLYERMCDAFQTRVTVILIFLPCYRRWTLTTVVLTLIQDCKRHRYLQSNNILSDNIPIKSYSESFQRAK